MTTIQCLESGYWHVRFNANQFIQWPCGRTPIGSDGFPSLGVFGAPTGRQFGEAERLVNETVVCCQS